MLAMLVLLLKSLFLKSTCRIKLGCKWHFRLSCHPGREEVLHSDTQGSCLIGLVGVDSESVVAHSVLRGLGIVGHGSFAFAAANISDAVAASESEDLYFLVGYSDPSLNLRYFETVSESDPHLPADL